MPEGSHLMSDSPLSVAIVCKNSESVIAASLASVAGLAGEIVAIDSGSTDGTLAMLDAAGARVIHSAWLGHVRTKQLALEAATRPWVLCLDSDESLLPELAASLRSVIDRPGGEGPDGYELNRVVWYRGRPLRYAWQPEWRLRLVRRGRARWGGTDPHDKLSLTGPGARPSRLTGTLRHDSFATFREHLGKQLVYSRLSAEGMLAEGRRTTPLRMALSPLGAMAKQLIGKQAWRDGYAGWLAAGTAGAGTLMKHMMLLEMQHAETASPHARSTAQ